MHRSAIFLPWVVLTCAIIRPVMAQGVVTMSEGTTYGKASLERVASEETTPGNPPADTPDPPDTTGAPVLDDRMFSIGGNAGLIVSNVEGVHTGFALTARGDIFITPHLSFRADVIYAELFSNAEVILDGSPPPHDNEAIIHIVQGGLRYWPSGSLYVTAGAGYLWYALKEPAAYVVNRNTRGPARFAFSYFGETAPTIDVGIGWESRSRGSFHPYAEFGMIHPVTSIAPTWSVLFKLGFDVRL